MKLDLSDAKELAKALDLISASIALVPHAPDPEKALQTLEPALRELHAGLTRVFEL